MSEEVPNGNKVVDVAEELAKHAITVHGWFAYPQFRANPKGDIHGAVFHFASEDWERFIKNHPKNVEITITWWPTETEEAVRYEAEKAKKEVKTKSEKGIFGHFWQALFVAGFPNCPGVAEAIDEALKDEPDDVPAHDRAKIGLRRIFDVESLTTVSPEQAAARFLSIQARTMIQQAQKRSGHKEREAA